MTISAEEIATKLLRCPFCGGKAEIERTGTMRQSNIVACTHCGARNESGDVFDPTASWNKRHSIHAEIERRDARIAALEAQLTEAVAALEPFAKEESTWATSVADDYRPGIVEPNQRTAYSKAEFSIGDLRRAAAIRARSEQEGK